MDDSPRRSLLTATKESRRRVRPSESKSVMPSVSGIPAAADGLESGFSPRGNRVSRMTTSSHRITRHRTDSFPTPTCLATACDAAVKVEYSPRCSKTSRTALAFSSGSIFFGMLLILPDSNRSRIKPGALQYAQLRIPFVTTEMNDCIHGLRGGARSEDVTCFVGCRGRIAVLDEGILVRKADRPEVWLIQNGKRRWVPDPETLQSQWSWAQVQVHPGSDVDPVPVGDPLPSVKGGGLWPDGSLITCHPAPEVYVIEAGKRRWIPDPGTFTAKNYDWAAIESIDQVTLASIAPGLPLPSITPPLRMCFATTSPGPALPPRAIPVRPPLINSDGTITGVQQDPLTGYTEKMWDVGCSLTIAMSGGSAFVRSKIRQFAEEWLAYANIKFAWIDAMQGPSAIRIAINNNGRSESAIGRDALSFPQFLPTMNFGWFTDETDDVEFRRVVVHEFGHFLGLVHEHQSPIAGIQWDKDKTYAYFEATQGWNKADVDANVFTKYSVNETNYSKFDSLSIMEYAVPAELTLDGVGAPWNTDLDATDKEYIRRWYPPAPTPDTAKGLLRTGDDCDEIDFNVEYAVVDAGHVGFVLQPAGITWWKRLDVPVSTGYAGLEMQDGHSYSTLVPVDQLDHSRPLRFWKAKAFGVHTLLGYTWDVVAALPGGSRLTLTWKRDRC